MLAKDKYFILFERSACDKEILVAGTKSQLIGNFTEKNSLFPCDGSFYYCALFSPVFWNGLSYKKIEQINSKLFMREGFQEPIV